MFSYRFSKRFTIIANAKPFWPAANEPNIAASLLHLGLITVWRGKPGMASPKPTERVADGPPEKGAQVKAN